MNINITDMDYEQISSIAKQFKEVVIKRYGAIISLIVIRA